MKANIRELSGTWNLGYAIDKHKISSTYIGDNQFGHPMFDTLRTDAGEAVYQLKYKHNFDQSVSLAKAVFEHIIPLLPEIGLIIPMPASQSRQKQPVDAIADDLANLMGLKSFPNIIVKAPSTTGRKLKDLNTKGEKDAELAGRFSINDAITNQGEWNALLIDDLFDTGASMEAATNVLRTYKKIKGVYVAALTWK